MKFIGNTTFTGDPGQGWSYNCPERLCSLEIAVVETMLCNMLTVIGR